MRSPRVARTGLGAAVLVVFAVLAATAPVTAQKLDAPPPREYGETGVVTGVVHVGARSEWLPVGSEGRTSAPGCTTFSVAVIVDDDFAQPVNREWRRFSADGSIPFTAAPTDLHSTLPTYYRHFGPTGRWYGVTCDGVTTVLPEGGPAVNIAGLVAEALDRLDPPEPELAVTPADLHFTQLPSWLAVAPTYWNATRAVDVAAGRVLVSASLTPLDARWSMGDGTVLVCTGPGTVWRAGLAATDNDCAHTYRRSSAGAPGDAFELTATVRFDVGVTTNAPGSYGPFADITRETARSVQVGEIQAVND